MITVFSFVGILATTIFVIASASINYQFGISLGRSNFDAHLFGAISVAADIFKAVLPLVIIQHWQQRNRLAGIASFAIWSLCVTYSLISSLGFAALNRAHFANQHQVIQQTLNIKRSEITALQTQLQRLVPLPSVIELRRQLTKLQAHKRWVSSSGCTNATVPASRQFCAQYKSIAAQLEMTSQRASLETRISQLRSALTAITSEQTAEQRAPRETLIAQFINSTDSQVSGFISLLLALLIEIASGLGCLVLVPLMVKFSQAPPKASDQPLVAQSLCEQFANDCISPNSDLRIQAAELYSAYITWSQDTAQTDRLTVHSFGRQLKELGYKKAKIGGKVYYLDVMLL